MMIKVYCIHILNFLKNKNLVLKIFEESYHFSLPKLYFQNQEKYRDPEHTKRGECKGREQNKGFRSQVSHLIWQFIPRDSCKTAVLASGPGGLL